MARIRSVKPEFWTDEDLSEVSRDARLLYIGLWNLSDEHGRLRGDPRYVKGQLFPYDDDLTATAVDGLLGELESEGKVVRYRTEDRQYLFVPNLHKHQRLESDKVPSKLPPPPGADSSESRADESARGAEKSARTGGEAAQARDQGKQTTQVGADESARGADENSLLYVTGSMEQVAGNRDTRADKPRGTETDDPDFERFWAAYPKRVEKVAARKAWKAAVKKAKSPDALIAAAERYRDERKGQDSHYTVYPARWLERGRWEDEPAPVGANRSNGWDGPFRNPTGPDTYAGYRNDIPELEAGNEPA